MLNLKSPKNQTDSASDNGSLNKVSDKLKLNTLKRAVLDLREEKSQLIKQIADLSQKNNQLIQERQDMEGKHQSTIRDLQLKLTLNASTLIQSSYQTESNNNNIDQSKQVTKLQQEFETTTSNYQAKFNILVSAYKEIELELKKKDYANEKLAKELEEKTQLNNQLKKNIEEIERELYNKIKDLKAERMEIQLKLKTLDIEIQEKDEEIRKLHKGLDESRFAVIQLQGELEETRGKFIQQKLILHNQFIDIECLFILRQNLFNDYIFELETAAQKFCYKVSEITDLTIRDETSFYLTVKSRSKDEVFRIMPNQDLKKICKSIKNFLLKAQQCQVNQQHTQAQSYKNNGLLGGLMSILGSTSFKNTSNTNNHDKQK